MEKQDFMNYCAEYVKYARFTPKSGSIPQARVEDLEALTNLAERMNHKVLRELTSESVGAVCSAYYLGKYGDGTNTKSKNSRINHSGGMPLLGHRHAPSSFGEGYSAVSGHRHD